MKINGVELAYEVIGRGAPMVWTPGGWLPRTNECYLVAGRFCSNFSVLIWDRRNCGQSDLAVDLDAPTEFHPYAEDLHVLLRELGMAPAYIAGGSGGMITSLLLAQLHPADVRGLILHAPPTMDGGVLEGFREKRYLDYANLAQNQGMEAVAETAAFGVYWPELCKRSPENKDRLLSIPPDKFATTMRRWATLDRWYCAGLPDDELARILVPALVTHPLKDDLHPRESAEALHRLLPASEFGDYPTYYSGETIIGFENTGLTIPHKTSLIAPAWEAFLRRLEQA